MVPWSMVQCTVLQPLGPFTGSGESMYALPYAPGQTASALRWMTGAAMVRTGSEAVAVAGHPFASVTLTVRLIGSPLESALNERLLCVRLPLVVACSAAQLKLLHEPPPDGGSTDAVP